MSYIGINEFVIGTVHDRDTWYYAGDKGIAGYYSPFLSDAVRYNDIEVLRDELLSLSAAALHKILEIQKCPKCGKEFTDYPAISRDDNETEICPECGIFEAIESASEVLSRVNNKEKGE